MKVVLLTRAWSWAEATAIEAVVALKSWPVVADVVAGELGDVASAADSASVAAVVDASSVGAESVREVAKQSAKITIVWYCAILFELLGDSFVIVVESLWVDLKNYIEVTSLKQFEAAVKKYLVTSNANSFLFILNWS